MGEFVRSAELGDQVCEGRSFQSGLGTNGGKSCVGGAPVQPLASSPRPWRNMTVAGEVEGIGAGIVVGGWWDMI